MRRATLRSAVLAVAGAMALLAGATAPVAADPATQFEESGGCTYYANSNGMGVYCVDGAVEGPTLIERFGGAVVDVCKTFRVPDGMQRPDVTFDDKYWVLEGCLKDINWNTVYGGADMYVEMRWTLRDAGDPPEDEDDDIADFLWNYAQDNYPMPLAEIRPSGTVRVNSPAIFTFRWVDGADPQLTPVQQGPYQGDERGGPYIQVAEGGVTMTAEASNVRLDPLVKGMESKNCGPNPPPFDESLGNDPADQETDCYLEFSSTSAAADELSTIELPDSLENTFIVSIEVTWEISVERQDGSVQQLPDQVMQTYQQVPVVQSEGVVIS